MLKIMKERRYRFQCFVMKWVLILERFGYIKNVNNLDVTFDTNK